MTTAIIEAVLARKALEPLAPADLVLDVRTVLEKAATAALPSAAAGQPVPSS